MRVDTLGPGTISVAGASNYRGAFTPDGNAYYFFRKVGPGESYRIFVSHRAAGQWSPPVQVALGGDYSDLYPTISGDGRQMVISSYRPLPGAAADARPQAHLWLAQREGETWRVVRPLEEINRVGFYHAGPILTTGGTLTWFELTPDYRQRVAKVAQFDGRRFSGSRDDTAHVAWGARMPTGFKLLDVIPSPNGQMVILGASAIGNNGRDLPGDLWLSIRRGAAWDPPVLLPPSVNSRGWENFATFSPDGSTLLFTRDFSRTLSVRVADLLSQQR